MIEEKFVKTHLIVTDIHEEYSIQWFGKIKDTQPELKNGLPIFIIIGKNSRIELNTIDFKLIEASAKQITFPQGREAITTDKAYIYIKEKYGKNTCIGVVTHKHIKTYAPMYDKVGYR